MAIHLSLSLSRRTTRSGLSPIKVIRILALVASFTGLVTCSSPVQPLPGREDAIQKALQAGTGVVNLPPGIIQISTGLSIPSGAHDLVVQGDPEGTVLRMTDDFQAKAVITIHAARGVQLRGISVEGNRDTFQGTFELPPSDVTFAEFYTHNGLLAEDTASLSIIDIKFRKIPGFAILINNSSGVVIEKVQIEESGSRNKSGRNNTSGGILLEGGTSDFSVLGSLIRKVSGNGIWTHSLYTAPRNRNGRIADNHFDTVARDAIQVGHATGIRVENNSGRSIGFPFDAVDAEGGGTPVAIDTAGNTDRSVYAANRFEEINGKCIDLDGFHDGEIRGNVCINRLPAESYPHGHFGIVFNNANPDMQSANITVVENVIDGAKFGGIFLIGTGHLIARNHLRNLNVAHCNEEAARFGCYHFPDEPDLLQSGIYLGRGAERPAPARGNTVRDNQISGYRMSTRCIALAPGISASDNEIEGNRCADQAEGKK